MTKKELNVKMSIEVPNQENVIKYQLSIDEDTGFYIYFDIYKYEEKEYLYFKMEEHTADAPFFYDVSYVKGELDTIHRIFKACDMDQVKDHLETLFASNKVKLHYEDEEKTMIIMEFKAILFNTEYIIPFKLQKEMIREEEKDAKMIKLYNIDKMKLKIANLLYHELKSNGDIYKTILDELMANFDLKEKPENNNNPINTNNEIDEEYLSQIKKIFNKTKKGVAKKCEKGLRVDISIKNKSKKIWPIGIIQFKIDEENSKTKLKCQEVIYPDYEMGKNQDGDFSFIFDENVQFAEYSCLFDVFIDGKKLSDTKLELAGKIKRK